MAHALLVAFKLEGFRCGSCSTPLGSADWNVLLSAWRSLAGYPMLSASRSAVPADQALKSVASRTAANSSYPVQAFFEGLRNCDSTVSRALFQLPRCIAESNTDARSGKWKSVSLPSSATLAQHYPNAARSASLRYACTCLGS